MRVLRLPSAALLAAALAGGCGPRGVTEVPEGAQADRRLLALGQEALESNDWETARTYFRQLLDSYPRSEFAGDARLGVADTYYSQRGAQNATLAATEFRDYLTFFPNHPRADYAQYRIAFGHYRRRRGADRDQEDTRLAVEEFKKLLELYPNSRYAEEATGYLRECEDELAEAMMQIAEFYQDQRRWCRGAIPRLEEVLATWPSFTRADETRMRLGRALIDCGRGPEALVHFQKVVEESPDSLFAPEARERIRELIEKGETEEPG